MSNLIVDWRDELAKAEIAYNEYMSQEGNKTLDTAYQHEVDLAMSQESDQWAQSKRVDYLQQHKYKKHCEMVSKLRARMDYCEEMVKQTCVIQEGEPMWWLELDDSNKLSRWYEKPKGKSISMRDKPQQKRRGRVVKL